jgi:phage shock protein A
VTVPAWLLAELEGRAHQCLRAEDPTGGAHELAALALEVVARARAEGTPYRASAPPAPAAPDEHLALVAGLEREISELRGRIRELEAMLRREGP